MPSNSRHPTRQRYRPVALILAMTALYGVSSASALAQAQPKEPDAKFVRECERRLDPTKIDVTVRQSDVIYNFTKSVAELTRMSPMAGKEANTLGLATAQSSHTSKWNYDQLSDKTGYGCMRPTFSVVLTAEEHTVYVAKEFKRGTCAFNEILEHEHRHVATTREHHAEVAQKLRQELTSFFGQRIFYGDTKLLAKQLTEAVKEHWLSKLKADMERVKEKQALIDTPQEYARSKTVCGGEIPKILRRAGR